MLPGRYRHDLTGIGIVRPYGQTSVSPTAGYSTYDNLQTGRTLPDLLCPSLEYESGQAGIGHLRSKVQYSICPFDMRRITIVAVCANTEWKNVLLEGILDYSSRRQQDDSLIPPKNIPI